MYRNLRIPVLLTLLAAVALSTALSGCGAVDTAKQVANTAKELATQAPNVAKDLATQVPQQLSTPAKATTAKPGATPTEEVTQLENAFNNLVKLAPVHLSSSFVSKAGDKVNSSLSYEADLDAAGNQHMKLVSGTDQPVEIYVVDGKMYLGTGEGQFMPMGDVEKDTGFAFLTVYGGAYLLAFNDLSDAKLVGSETIGPWRANKYQVNMDLASFGLAGLAAGTQGAQWQYQGFAWVEPSKGALVKAVTDWSGKAAGAAETESYHSEFVASKGTVTKITAPENLVNLGG